MVAVGVTSPVHDRSPEDAQGLGDKGFPTGNGPRAAGLHHRFFPDVPTPLPNRRS